MLAYRVYMEGSVFQISNGQDDTLYKVRKREASLQDGGEGGQENAMGMERGVSKRKLKLC